MRLTCNIIIILAILFASNLHAFEIKIQPEEVAPGDLFVVEIPAKGNESAEIEFLKKTYALYPVPSNKLAALIPVDINTNPRNYTVTCNCGKEKQTATLTVKEHEFKTIKLTLPKGKVSLSPENQKRANKEAVIQNNIWSQNSSKVWAGNFIAPLNTEISTLFGVKRIMNEKKTSVHRGMDFRGKTGTPVKAINMGTAVLSKDLFFGGNTLIVDHGMGLFSVYMHLSKINVSNGEKVLKGDVVGLVGMSGRATGPHLHLSVKLKGVSINPDALFKLKL